MDYIYSDISVITAAAVQPLDNDTWLGGETLLNQRERKEAVKYHAQFCLCDLRQFRAQGENASFQMVLWEKSGT